MALPWSWSSTLEKWPMFCKRQTPACHFTGDSALSACWKQIALATAPLQHCRRKKKLWLFQISFPCLPGVLEPSLPFPYQKWSVQASLLCAAPLANEQNSWIPSMHHFCSLEVVLSKHQVGGEEWFGAVGAFFLFCWEKGKKGCQDSHLPTHSPTPPLRQESLLTQSQVAFCGGD